MLIDKTLLDQLTEQAKASPRLRQHYDLRDSSEDESQRMLNAIEPGTVIPIHRHTQTSEEVVILRGRAEEVFYDNTGKETGRYLLVPLRNCVFKERRCGKCYLGILNGCRTGALHTPGHHTGNTERLERNTHHCNPFIEKYYICIIYILFH